MERALVNFFYCHPVGHAVEALYYANGHRGGSHTCRGTGTGSSTSPATRMSSCGCSPV
nr:hypothetical protein [Kibdelosporangium sp. MJ126-NF4]CTQ90794.1 hypothetical protein [Kibdelosporangium sp. MJ126-NF4]